MGVARRSTTSADDAGSDQRDAYKSRKVVPDRWAASASRTQRFDLHLQRSKAVDSEPVQVLRGRSRLTAGPLWRGHRARKSPACGKRQCAAIMDRLQGELMLLDECRLPVVLAPLAGGPSTPELCAAVSQAGGLGFLAAGYLPAADLESRIRRTRALTPRPFGVNLFVPAPPADPAVVEEYARRLEPAARELGIRLGEPRNDDDDWEAKLALLNESQVPLVSFTFGCPAPDVISRLQGSGSEVWVTTTTVEEACLAQAAGADGLVVQGLEAGGHRGGFTDIDDAIGLLALLQLVGTATSLPMIAAGAIATGAGLAAALTAGARAGALGTAFLRCPEAGTSSVHRHALEQQQPTAVTRAFTGRLARGVRNRFMDEHSDAAPPAYPLVHHLTAPLRAYGRTAGDADLVNLWAGQAYPLSADLPAGEVVGRVAADARTALDRARRLLD